ncbi:MULTISPECIES: hypothetical protein [Bradyrhizobium]|uniref:hypothetical protein n=1 Tax=Bradyrhizobium TaxID=374 RepID=UPI00115FF0E2|nr:MULTISPECIES: hypothetical protein [Bradyrhizobium]MCP1909929.1 hypothetical protein [Bradyrhizobium elkanii]
MEMTLRSAVVRPHHGRDRYFGNGATHVFACGTRREQEATGARAQWRDFAENKFNVAGSN